MLPQQWNGWTWLAIGWFIFITVLFFLPGSSLPKEHWLDQIHADKFVHIGFFAMLLFFWRFLFSKEGSIVVILLLVAALIYGVMVEIIQGAFVLNRSSDPWDVVADMTGAALGLYVWSRGYKKNRPL